MQCSKDNIVLNTPGLASPRRYAADLDVNADRAAKQIISACRYGRAKITLSLLAKLAVVANAFAPELTADVNSLAASLLPARGGIGRTAVAGHESESNWSPSKLTTLVNAPPFATTKCCVSFRTATKNTKRHKNRFVESFVVHHYRLFLLVPFYFFFG